MSKSQPWRYRCPNNHTAWHHRQSEYVDSGGEYYCTTCQRYGDDPHFDELKDMKNA